MDSDRDAQSVMEDGISTTQLIDMISVVEVRSIDSFRLCVVGAQSEACKFS
jgi:hypothetical protein